MNRAAEFRRRARFLRQATNSENVEITLRKAVSALAASNIPHFVIGGLAIQERGYPRFTSDVDLVVPSVEVAADALASAGFERHQDDRRTAVVDPQTAVKVNLLPGGERIDPGPLALPIPVRVSMTPRILPLRMLISMKLSTSIGLGMRGARHLADAVELMKANSPARGFDVDPLVRSEYVRVWDELFQKL